MKNNDKTNVMRVLDSKKIAYTAHTYEQDPTMTGAEIAQILGEDADKVFKTLVTQAKSGQYYVFVVRKHRESICESLLSARRDTTADALEQRPDAEKVEIERERMCRVGIAAAIVE